MLLYLTSCSIRSVFFTLIFSMLALSADVEDHFKKMGDKSGVHQMRNIDFIYMINLDERPEKFQDAASRLNPYGVFPCRFSAVNGWKLSLEVINDVGVKYGPWLDGGKWGTCYLPDGEGTPHHEIVQTVGRNYFCHCMSRGAVGIALSHLSILQDAYDSGYETIWVLEDDIEVIRDPRILSDLIDRLDLLVGKEGWDILFTDKDTKNTEGQYVPCTAFAWRPNFAPANPARFAERVQISPDFRRVGARFGAYSMIVRRSGMKKLLNFFKNYQIFLPFDIDYTFPADIRFYTVMEDVVSTLPRALSDNGSPNYQNRASEK